MNRYKPIGWRYESYRHSLAARGFSFMPMRKKRPNKIGGYVSMTEIPMNRLVHKLDTEIESLGKVSSETEPKVVDGVVFPYSKIYPGVYAANVADLRAYEAKLRGRKRKLEPDSKLSDVDFNKYLVDESIEEDDEDDEA
jgi:hypothetical protein